MKQSRINESGKIESHFKLDEILHAYMVLGNTPKKKQRK